MSPKILAPLLISAALLLPCGIRAAATIDAANHDAWGGNIGWVDWRGDLSHGAVIGDYTCSGYLYAANIGWINLGSGSPANGIRYQNLSAGDFGVNNDGLGNLRGYAWGANIGWINFETNGAPKVDLATGKMSGYLYSANCGWISLSNAVAFVQTDSFSPGPLAPDGLPIPWLLVNFGTTNVSATTDPDGDGMSNADEYAAGTNPNDPASNLKITGGTFALGGTNVALAWSSVANRFYRIEESLNLAPALWQDSGLGLISPDGATTTRNLTQSNAPIRFYRVEAVRPLSP